MGQASSIKETFHPWICGKEEFSGVFIIDLYLCLYICIHAPVLRSGGPFIWLVPLYKTHKEHTIRTFTGDIPSAMRNTHRHEHTLPPVEWSALYTGVCHTWVHDISLANMTQGVASAFHGETHTMGVPSHIYIHYI